MTEALEVEKSELFLELWAQAQDGTNEYPPHSCYQIITAEIAQMGKTSYALRIAEVLSERLKGRRFDWKANTHFEYGPFMERRRELYNSGQEWDFQVADEPQRIAGARDYWSIQNKRFAEELQTNNYRHIHALLPCPGSQWVDTALYNVCTSQSSIKSVGHATIYSLKRQELDRSSRDVHTKRLCWITFEKPSFWAGFCKMRDEYNDARSLANIEVVKAEAKEASTIPAGKSIEELEAEIMANPQLYIGKNGKISVKKVLQKQPSNYPYNRAQRAVGNAQQRLEDKEALEKAERDGN